MAKLNKITNGNYVGPNKYTITDSSDGKKEITFAPDQVLEEGTPVGAEILNEIQRNGLYYLEGTKRVSGQTDIYDCTLEGIDTFEFTKLAVLFKPNANSTNSTVQLNISGQLYTINQPDNKLTANANIGLLLIKVEKKAYSWLDLNDKLDKGTIPSDWDSAEKIKGKIEDIDKKGYKADGYGSFRISGAWDNIYHSGEYYGLNDELGYAYLHHIHYNENTNGFAQLAITDRGDKVKYRGKEANNPNATVTPWTEILTEKSKLFLGNAGITKVKYIQDVGEKVAYYGYIDKVTGKLYRAKVTNNDVDVTNNFEPADNINLLKQSEIYVIGERLDYSSKNKTYTLPRPLRPDLRFIYVEFSQPNYTGGVQTMKIEYKDKKTGALARGIGADEYGRLEFNDDRTATYYCDFIDGVNQVTVQKIYQQNV